MRLGVDLGGSKIEIVALAADGREMQRRRVATPRGDYHATVAAIASLVEQVEHELGQRGSVGIGIPGTESAATGRIKNANSTWLIGQPLRRDLQTLLLREVRIANDANCFALSEAADGAAAGADVVFGVILGTGVGGGIVVHNKALTGANGIAGEWGHNAMPRGAGIALCPLRGMNDHPPAPLPEEGGDHTSSLREPDCYCGRRGCIETYLSGPGLAADHLRATGTPLTAEQIARAAAAGDSDCEATLQRYEVRLARALAQVINVLDPDVIVLGGGLSNLDRLYVSVPQQWAAHIFSDSVLTRLLKHRHGDSSGVRGAAALWP
ncbi:MAG: ROK family protein [Rhodocyclaceae bacterium]|jgi:fructokinase|nr:ROK family protein [Rhodocyclaceae bacterium]